MEFSDRNGYARARLLLGINAVGIVVVVCLLGVVTGAPTRLLAAVPANFIDEAIVLALIIGAWAFMMLPFDIAGGFLLPNAYGLAAHRSLPAYLRSLLRGITLQFTFHLTVLVAVLQVGRQAGIVGILILATTIQFLMLFIQGRVAKVLGNLSAEEQETTVRPVVEWITHRDPGFTGGIVGWPGQERILLPSAWRDRLPATEVDAQVMHRIVALRSGARTRGIAVSVAWNTLCLGLAFLLPGAGAETLPGVVTAWLWFNLLSFVCLLLMPFLSRRAVFEVDAEFERCGGDSEALIDGWRNIEQLHDHEPSRSPGLESVFHPIPCLERRKQRLRNSTIPGHGAWQTSRLTLYLAWSFAGLLSRAVHCNVGRPELWALMPCP